MDSSDRLLMPCLIASLIINGIGVLVVSNASVFDPSRRPPPAAPEARRYAEIPRDPTPTPKPVQATPTPPPTPTPVPTPDRLASPTPTPYTRPQTVASTPRPNQLVARHDVPLKNLGLGNAGTRGDLDVSQQEVKSDLAVGTKANTTVNVVAPVKQDPAPIVAPPTPVPTTPGPSATPKPAPLPTPPPAPVVHRATISSEPAVPLNGWDSITGSISVGDDFDPSQLRRKSIVVSIETDASGDVKNVSITQSCGVSSIDDQIRKSCYKQHYKPPTEDGVALPSHFTHTFNLSF